MFHIVKFNSAKISCYRDTAEDIEHPPLVGGVFGIVNRQGKILMDKISYDPSPEFWSKLDSLSMTFYENEFQYTAFEKNIIKKLDPYKTAIEKVYFTKYADNKKRPLVFDIVEKPVRIFLITLFIQESFAKTNSFMIFGTNSSSK